MRLLLLVLLAGCVSNAAVNGALALPSWTEEEKARLKKGEIVPGASLLVESGDAALLTKPGAARDEPEEAIPEPDPEPEYDPRTIPSKHLATYFQKLPEGYLVDPQRLLTMQETQDREGFLDYHAQDSDIDIRLYLFDAQQQIPAPYSLRKLVQERYARSPLTAVVFCFVGDPSRTMLAFGGKGAEHVAAQERIRVLDSARIKSLEKSDASEQVEAFIVQLSIRLYWLEKSLQDVAIATAAATPPSGAETGKSPEPAAAPGLLARYRTILPYVAVGGGGVLLALGAMAAAWHLWWGSRKYRFPVIEIPRRLGADYGAGVGAVLGFRDSFGSPSHQRDQVPDYLMRP